MISEDLVQTIGIQIQITENRMQIIEKTVVGKNPKKKSEDGIVVTNNFVAVIDGSTSKSKYRHSRWRSNGCHAMRLVASYIASMPKNTTSEQFLRGVTAAIRRHYKKKMMAQLEEHPEDRLTCSVVVYSRLCREIWMVGDCQCLINGELYDNPKPYEEELAAMRAAEARRQMAEGRSQEELLREDTARPVIIPRMLETMRDADGVGLAGPQVGVLRRVIVVETEPGQTYMLVNPEITESRHHENK